TVLRPDGIGADPTCRLRSVSSTASWHCTQSMRRKCLPPRTIAHLGSVAGGPIDRAFEGPDSNRDLIDPNVDRTGMMNIDRRPGRRWTVACGEQIERRCAAGRASMLPLTLFILNGLSDKLKLQLS